MEKYNGKTCKYGADEQLKIGWDQLTAAVQSEVLAKGASGKACDHAKKAVVKKIFGTFSDQEATTALAYCCNKKTLTQDTPDSSNLKRGSTDDGTKNKTTTGKDEEEDDEFGYNSLNTATKLHQSIAILLSLVSSLMLLK
jgi:hypothetical protein